MGIALNSPSCGKKLPLVIKISLENEETRRSMSGRVVCCAEAIVS